MQCRTPWHQYTSRVCTVSFSVLPGQQSFTGIFWTTASSNVEQFSASSSSFPPLPLKKNNMVWYLAPIYCVGGSKGFLCHVNDSNFLRPRWVRIWKQKFLCCELSGDADCQHSWQICASIGLSQPSLKSRLYSDVGMCGMHPSQGVL